MTELTIEIAQQKLAEGKAEELLDWFEGKKEDQLDAVHRQIKAMCLQRVHRFEDALQLWNGLLQGNPYSAVFNSERGVCKFNLGYKSAIEDFDKAVELDPHNPYRYSSRAYVLDKMGRIKEAIKDYQKAIELDPEDEVSRNNLEISEQKVVKTRRSKLFKDLDNAIKEHEGITEDIQPEPEPSPLPKITPDNQEEIKSNAFSKWDEVRKMLSSKKEFARFWKEAKGLFKK